MLYLLVLFKEVREMKVLVIIEAQNSRRFLVTLHTDDLIREVKRLVARKKHTQAILSALVKGRFEKEVRSYELNDLGADLILSETAASWDLLK